MDIIICSFICNFSYINRSNIVLCCQLTNIGSFKNDCTVSRVEYVHLVHIQTDIHMLCTYKRLHNAQHIHAGFVCYLLVRLCQS